MHAAIGAGQPTRIEQASLPELTLPGHVQSFGRKRRTYRTEQLIAYLQSRGELPAVKLHDLIRQGWRKLQKDLGCSALEAWDRWFAMVTALLPYTAAKLATLEVKGDPEMAAGAAGLHLLAAHAMAGELAAIRSGGIANDDGTMEMASLRSPFAPGARSAPDAKSGATQQVLDIAGDFTVIPAQLPEGMPLE